MPLAKQYAVCASCEGPKSSRKRTKICRVCLIAAQQKGAKFSTHSVFGYRRIACPSCSGSMSENNRHGKCIHCYNAERRSAAQPSSIQKQCIHCGSNCYSARGVCSACWLNTVRNPPPPCSKCGKRMSKHPVADIPICHSCRTSTPELHGHWNPNIPQSERASPNNRILLSGYKEWRVSVLARCNSRCCACWKRQSRAEKLHCHHILNYKQHDALRLDPNNGAALCIDCHKRFHHTFGNKDNTREQFNSFIAATVGQQVIHL